MPRKICGPHRIRGGVPVKFELKIFHFPGEGKKGSVFAAALRGSTGSYQHKSRLIRTVTDPKCPHKHETAGPACASAGPLSSGSV